MSHSNFTYPAAPEHVVSLREAPHRMAIAETTMRYDVLLNGTAVGELYFNMHGYVGTLPLPNGKQLSIPESAISRFEREIRRINRDAKFERVTS